MRVEKPHDVPYGCLALVVAVKELDAGGRAKFWPSMWLVPACRALPSRIIASIEWL